MTGFAGSRSLDERRRRRLATGAETVALETVAEPAPRRAAPTKVKQKRRSPSHFPLRKVISARYWKLAAIVLCAALAGVAILGGGWAAANYGQQLGPGFVLLFGLDAARLVRGSAAVGLLLAGQLALLISWARSQSLQDFNGRYRGWVFCALLAFVAAFGMQTQLAAAWSATAGWLWTAQFAHKATLLWLIPTACCGIFVHGYCVREMRDCRVSLTLAWLTFVLGGGVTGIVLARPLPWPTPQARLIECGVALLFVVCAFASALFHARHVVYVCVDPPAIRPSRSLAVLKLFRLWALFKFNRSGSTKKSGKPAERETVKALKRRTPKRTKPLRRKPSEDESDKPQAAPQSAPGSARKPTPVVREDEPEESDAEEDETTSSEADSSARRGDNPGSQFAGMSRRERRLLKKQMRTEPTQLRRSA
jgi:hypothetical protein